MTSLPPDFLRFLAEITGKRARIVIEHILQHGSVTTEDLELIYGYKHPPRAIRDVREQGVPLETFQTRNAQGRAIAAYRFPDNPQWDSRKLGGRKAWTKAEKDRLVEQTGPRCAICLSLFEPKDLPEKRRKAPAFRHGDIRRRMWGEFCIGICRGKIRPATLFVIGYKNSGASL